MTDQNPMRIAEELRRRLQYVPADDKLWVGIEESMDGLCSVAELLALADALDEERKHADKLAARLRQYVLILKGDERYRVLSPLDEASIELLATHHERRRP